MPKFSIIIPVYNVEKYICKCIESVMNQTFKDYEVIVVNDGTKDNSIEKIKDYPVKIINQKNEGLSSARNKGVSKATGDYLIFLDSDDYWENNLLEKINESLENKPDVVRFQIKEVFENNEEKPYKEEPFENLKGPEAFSKILNYHFIENAWCYAIKKDYYKKNKYQFAVGTVHEDFGLMPLIIIKANKVNSIEYLGYNYVQRQGSIMSNKAYEKTIKKVSDMYKHYQYLEKEIDKTKIESVEFKSYIANSILTKICELKSKEYKEYKKLLKQKGVNRQLLRNTPIRKIKGMIVDISPKLFYSIKR